MDVSCPRCETLYELDPQQVRHSGATLKCSQCGYIFRLDSSDSALDESQRRWMVRKAGSGDILYFTSFDTLHRWIMERSVGPRDTISRTGQKWTELESIGEFMPIFQVLASIAKLTNGPDEAPDSQIPQSPASGLVPQTQYGNLPPGEQVAKPGRQRPGREALRDMVTTVPGRPGGAPELSRATRSEQLTPLAIPQAARASRRGEANTVQMPPHQVFRQEIEPAVPPVEAAREDTWSLGELSAPLEERPDRMEERPDGMTRGRRSRSWVVVLLLLIIGGAIAAFMVRGDLDKFGEILGLSSPGMQRGVQAEQMLSPREQALEQSSLAITQARQELRRAVAPFIEEAIDQAQVITASAQNNSLRQAQRAARPSVPELIAAGRRALERGEGATARGRFQAALNEEPRNPEALIGLGWAYLALGDHDGAVSRFNAALVQGKQAGEALIGMGRAERERGNTRAALFAYEEYLRRFPGGPHATIAQFQSEQLRSSLQ